MMEITLWGLFWRSMIGTSMGIVLGLGVAKLICDLFPLAADHEKGGDG